MSRQARKRSISGIYHILLRGINRQVIFEDEEDCNVFLATLEAYKNEFNCQIYAYCLMTNHIHLLVKISHDDLQYFMRKIGSKYVYWYNQKYNRLGGLFQDRYKSEPVDDESYFLTVLRYIHQNPVKAGICKNAYEYKYSSYHEYIKPKAHQIIDTAFALNMLGEKQFSEYCEQYSEDNCLEIREVARVNDGEAKAIIFEISQCSSASEFQVLPIDTRNRYLAEFKGKGLSIKQIERLTGINRGLVQKA